LIFQVNNYNKSKLDNKFKDEACETLNEILLENEKIEKIDLSCKLFKNNKREQNNIKRINLFKRVFVQ
jgi:hypothetical protein